MDRPTSSRFRGVRRSSKFRFQARPWCRDGYHINLGTFATEEEAMMAIRRWKASGGRKLPSHVLPKYIRRCAAGFYARLKIDDQWRRFGPSPSVGQVVRAVEDYLAASGRNDTVVRYSEVVG